MRRLGIVLLLVVAGCCGGADVPTLHTVEPGVLVRSAQPTAVGLAHLRDVYGVRTVINLNRQTIDEELVTAMALGLDYLPLPVDVYGLDRGKLVTVLAAIRQAEAEGRAPVLVHCKSGQDRTGVAIAAYRVVEQGWDGERALAEMERLRHWTHEALFPHLRGIPLSADERAAIWREAVERTGSVPVVRPPVPWEPSPTTRPSGLAPGSGFEATSRPGVL